MLIYRCLHRAVQSTNRTCLKRTCYCKLDPADPLLRLALEIPWDKFDNAFSIHYTQSTGAPSKPIRFDGGFIDSQVAGELK